MIEFILVLRMAATVVAIFFSSATGVGAGFSVATR